MASTIGALSSPSSDRFYPPPKGVRYITVKRTSDTAYSVFLNLFPTFIRRENTIYGYGRISLRSLGTFDNLSEAVKEAKSEALLQKINFLSEGKGIVTVIWVEQGYLIYRINGDNVKEIGTVSQDYKESETQAVLYAEKEGDQFVPSTPSYIEE